MPGPMTEGERQEFLAHQHVGVLSVASGDDRPPHTTPVWYAYEPGGNISFFTGTQVRGPRARGHARPGSYGKRAW
jgi:nitroimidazol reductase NimA-like FMN-containing flavoprotein (pyridoxamine 5'-phosphate oxidase superfamily)